MNLLYIVGIIPINEFILNYYFSLFSRCRRACCLLAYVQLCCDVIAVDHFLRPMPIRFNSKHKVTYVSPRVPVFLSIKHFFRLFHFLYINRAFAL